MGRNHDAGSLRCVARRFFPNSLSAQLLAHDRVVHEFAEDREWGFPGEGLRSGDGIADAKADAEMFRNDDLHLLCITK